MSSTSGAEMVRKVIVKRRWVVPPRRAVWLNGKKVVLPRKPRRVTTRTVIATKRDIEKATRERERQARRRR